MKSMSKEKKKDMLTKELKDITNMRDCYNEKATTIIILASMSFSGGVIFNYSCPEAQLTLYTIGILLSFIFWYLDTKYELSQSYMKKRIKLIERFIKRGEDIIIRPLQFDAEYYKVKDNKGLWKIALRNLFSTPYPSIIIGILVVIIYKQVIQYCACL